MGVGVAAADRYLKALKDVPGIVSVKAGQQTVVRFDRAHLYPPLPLSSAIAACFGSSLHSLFTGTSYAEGMRDAVRRLISQTKSQRRFAEIERKFLFLPTHGERRPGDDSAPLDDVIEAVLQQQWVRFKYQHMKGPPERCRVAPLSIAIYRHQLYVLARDVEGKVHPYRFSRMADVHRGEATFEYPDRAEYDPAQLFASSFGVFLQLEKPIETVKIRLAPRWVPYARTHRWHQTQRIEVDPEGVTVIMDVRVCPELSAWVLGFGDEARVLAPASLLKLVASQAKRTAAIYAEISRE